MQRNEDNKQQHYAIVKLEEAAAVVRQMIQELPMLRRRLDQWKGDRRKAQEVYHDLQQQHSRLSSAVYSAVLSLLEMELMELADYSVRLNRSIRSFNLMTPDYTRLCAVLSDYLSRLPVTDAFRSDTANAADVTCTTDTTNTTSASVIGRLMADVKMGYYPTDLKHIGYLARGIGFPEGISANLFDPCCGCGLALHTLAYENYCHTYGVELDRHRAEEALARLDRVGFGSYFRSSISRESFHLMLLNPPYLSVMTEGGSNTRSEKRFLVDSISHLLYGGLLVYIIPYYRLTPDICRILCDNFKDLTVWKFTGSEFRKFKQAAVLGVRRKRQDGSALVPGLAAMAMEPEALPELSGLPENRYLLPAVEKKVGLFKGAEFNTAELSEQMNKSDSFSRMFEKNKLDASMKRPLLPLNLGQIGLIGGSGLINGLVECDTPHIIKGRIMKENNISMEENTNSRGDLTGTTVYETRSNKMIFNLLTPEGFLSLVDYRGDVVTDHGNDTASGNGSDNGSVMGDLPAVKKKYHIPLGKTVITAGALEVLSDMDINTALARHQSGDWGEVTKADQRANDRALKNGGRILSAYTSADGTRFWIITEADRSYTTVLLPEDY